MLNNISTLDQIEYEATEIQKYLDTTCSDDPNEAEARGCDIMAYMARTGKMVADCQYWKDAAMISNTLLANETYKSMPPSTRNKLIESMCKRENYLHMWVDRLNRTCTHQLDFIRTLLSKAKAEMTYQNFNSH